MCMHVVAPSWIGALQVEGWQCHQNELLWRRAQAPRDSRAYCIRVIECAAAFTGGAQQPCGSTQLKTAQIQYR